jgi:hypothetical protein
VSGGDTVADVVQDLWPEIIRPTVLSPLAILTRQADALTARTKGVLRGEISRGPTEEDLTTLHFDIVVPELAGSRFRIMDVKHDVRMPYPATVVAEVFGPVGLAGSLAALGQSISGERKPVNRADNDDELVDLVGKVLRSPYVIAAIKSLQVKADERRAERERDVDSPPPPGS